MKISYWIDNRKWSSGIKTGFLRIWINDHEKHTTRHENLNEVFW